MWFLELLEKNLATLQKQNSLVETELQRQKLLVSEMETKAIIRNCDVDPDTAIASQNTLFGTENDELKSQVKALNVKLLQVTLLIFTCQG